MVAVGRHELPIVITCSLADAARAVLAERFAITPGSSLKTAVEEGQDIAAAVISIETPIGAALAARLPPSLVVATYSVGTDHLDLAALRERGIQVLNTPHVLSRAVAETAAFLVLSLARRATESIDLIRGGSWQGWRPDQLIGFELQGRTVGIVGMGRIGREIATVLRGFGVHLAYHDQQAAPGVDARYCSTRSELLGIADIVILACPATSETERMINRSTIAEMKRGAYVVNIARGSLIDDDALIEGLKSGHLGGAALDVFNREPSFDRRYLDLRNVFITPHVGSSTIEARVKMAEILRDGLLSLFAGEVPDNIVK